MSPIIGIRPFSPGFTIIGDGDANNLNGFGGKDTIDGGDGDDTLWGGDGDDTLQGSAGNDVLYGGTESDSMAGGTGNDFYQVDNAGDTVKELSGEGTDTVFATRSWTVTSAGIEAVYAVGFGILLRGSSGADVLVADALTGSVLGGEGGNDALWGQAGQDYLWGGAGDDTLRGGAGEDTLWGGFGNDQLVGGASSDTFIFEVNVNFGTDEIFDFDKLAGDRLVFTGFSQAATIQVVGSNTQVVMAQGVINLYGVTNLAHGDLLFSLI